MTEGISRSPLAEKDIVDLAEYYRVEAGLTVALRFVANAEAAMQALAAFPQIGATLGLASDHERDIRRWQIEAFPRLIVLYRPTEAGIHVIRVLDTARDIEDLFQLQS
ncbi:MAG: type II toxin-antitoxin system RelE/ParE family toxin [Planctomycetes bacterium]|nr:type II toxin-antitoxin system RelE/ParE family toxin [Planctomycetota bacterium]